jgi:hypothetical protein
VKQNVPDPPANLFPPPTFSRCFSMKQRVPSRRWSKVPRSKVQSQDCEPLIFDLRPWTSSGPVPLSEVSGPDFGERILSPQRQQSTKLKPFLSAAAPALGCRSRPIEKVSGPDPIRLLPFSDLGRWTRDLGLPRVPSRPATGRWVTNFVGHLYVKKFETQPPVFLPMPFRSTPFRPTPARKESALSIQPQKRDPSKITDHFSRNPG